MEIILVAMENIHHVMTAYNLAFEVRFWRTLTECSPGNDRIVQAFSATLSRASFHEAIKYYRSILAATPNKYYFVQKDVDALFKKNGDINIEIEFWETTVWETTARERTTWETAAWQHVGINAQWNKLMRLFKRRGDVDRAIKFWTDMVGRENIKHWQKEGLQRKLSETKKWKIEVDSALNFRGVPTGLE